MVSSEQVDDIASAFNLLYSMLAESIQPNRVTYDILLRAACIANDPVRYLALISSTQLASCGLTLTPPPRAQARFYELKQRIDHHGVALSDATVHLINEVRRDLRRDTHRDQPVDPPGDTPESAPTLSGRWTRSFGSRRARAHLRAGR